MSKAQIRSVEGRHFIKQESVSREDLASSKEHGYVECLFCFLCCKLTYSSTHNPLLGLSPEALIEDVDVFIKEKGLQDKQDLFRKAALLAQRPADYEDIPELTEDDRYHIRREKTRQS